LFYSIGEGEILRNFAIPSNIDMLVDVHNKEESDEDDGEIKVNKFSEEDTEFDKIESFCHIHHAAEHLRVVSDEVADCLNAEPGTHEGGAVGLVGKLEVIKTKTDTKEKNDDPVQNLEEEAAYSNRSIILA
jgi:hypothetical protein